MKSTESLTHPKPAPPIYAARFVLSDLGTKGGLVTDAAGRVLDESGTPIKGLDATSNSTASLFGSVYPGPGAPLARRWCSGRWRCGTCSAEAEDGRDRVGHVAA